ncbi:hypothetical protein SAMN05444064_10493 [Pseudomonas syringae]|uniref:Uncharacterized protein n=1 Tax=Pseudomonas cannabina TaxID=86840 RepID=A0A3M3QTG7_PSECA|nr:Uncharacterized protein ALO83_02459 [Pseudomonas cannabina pv. alisalensis]RMN78529.1 hypothetical protein ALQ53_01077 [Pseudomonas cannabina]SDW50500.1 hypothetical protein SAMN05444514_10493 [Pseudomonas syringae]RMN76152.1 hypothetical protein ALQ52_02284 [Pseudomonas cannabina pv. alisalensis]RMN87536.1 hypothetical protein ALQ51_02760 [Pseudomonas cannabina]
MRTRVLIRFTKLFWKDLGLAYVFERVQRSAKKRRDAQLCDIGQQRLADMEKHSLELQRRETSRQRWQAKENREAGVPDTQDVADSSTSMPGSNERMAYRIYGATLLTWSLSFYDPQLIEARRVTTAHLLTPHAPIRSNRY